MNFLPIEMYSCAGTVHEKVDDVPVWFSLTHKQKFGRRASSIALNSCTHFGLIGLIPVSLKILCKWDLLMLNPADLFLTDNFRLLLWNKQLKLMRYLLHYVFFSVFFIILNILSVPLNLFIYFLTAVTDTLTSRNFPWNFLIAYF